MSHVKFSSPSFNGDISCGTLIQSASTSTPPTMTFSKAIPQAFYTLMMMDPNGCNGVWPLSPDCPTGGNHHPPCSDTGNTPIHHWYVSNIPGSELQGGLSTSYEAQSGVIAGTGNGTTLWQFKSLAAPIVTCGFSTSSQETRQ